MRTVVAVLSLLLVALAGCSDGGDTTPDPQPPEPSDPGPSDPDPTPTPPAEPVTEVPLLSDFALDGCDGIVMATPATTDAVQSLLPSGYTVAAQGLGATAGMPLPTDQALLLAELYQCSTFTAAGSTFEDVWFGHAYTFVNAPDAFPDLSADVHAYTFEMIAGSDILNALWLAAGFPVHNGTTERVDVAPGAVSTVTAGDYTWELVTPPVPMDQGTTTFAWFHELSNGNTNVWTGSESYPSGALGMGTLAVPSGSAFEQALLGTGTTFAAQGYLMAGAGFQEMFLVQHLAEPL